MLDAVVGLTPDLPDFKIDVSYLHLLDAVVDLTTAVDVETMMLIGTEDRVSGSDVVEEANTDLETEVALEATDL